MTRLLIILINCALIGYTSTVDKSTELSVSAADILNAWKVRSDQTKSFDISWTESLLVRNTSMVKGKARLVMDDRGRIRYDSTSFDSQEVSAAFDGRGYKFQTHAANGSVTFPFLQISEYRLDTSIHENARLASILLLYRPFIQKESFLNPDSFVLIDENATFEGRPCVVVRSDLGGGTWMLWLDRDRGYVPLSFSFMRRNKVTHRASISYSEDGMHGWIPTAWKENVGEVYSCESTVLSCALNITAADDVFDIVPTEGTYVRDYTTGEEYIVRGSQGKRMVDMRDIGKYGYEALRNSDAPSQSITGFLGRYFFLFLLLGLVGFFFVVIRRRNRAR